MNVHRIDDETNRVRAAHQAIQKLDWSKTRAGDPSGWPAEWRAALSLCLYASVPVWLALGAELELVHNEAFGDLYGCAMKQTAVPLRAAWRASWHDRLEALIARVLVSERATSCELQTANGGSLSLTFSALHDDLGRPIGLFGTASPAGLGEQQRIVLHDLFRQGIRIRRLDEAVAVCSSALAGLTQQLSFVGLYLFDRELGMMVRCGHVAARVAGGRELPKRVEFAADAHNREAWLATAAERICALAEVDTRDVHSCGIEDRAGMRGLLLAGKGAPGAHPLERATLEALASHAGELIAYVDSRSACQSRSTLEEPLVSGADFVMNLSRQLRIPLGLLVKEIEDLLSAGQLSAETEGQLRVARRRARRLGRLVDVLLDLSRFDGHQVRPRLAATNLASATRQLCEVFRPAFEQAGIDFLVECVPLPEPAWVDRELWEKIVCNLLANALKFTLEGEVRVRLHSTPSELVLVVADTGCGIHESDIPLVFDRFFATRPANARSDEGAGVGLSWVRELVRLHDGTIRVSSALGRGSAFTIRIPYRRQHLRSEGSPEERTDALGSYEAPDTLEAMREWSNASPEDDAPEQLRLLIAEGDPKLQSYLRGLLGVRWQVEVVSDTESALARVAASRPGLVLADTESPGIDVAALARALQADPASADIPLILLCSRLGERYSIAGLDAAALDYVMKPLSSRDLLARVEGRLAQVRERRCDRAAREAAERESLMKDEVIALVAHELRAPMSAILGWLQVLRNDGDVTSDRRTKALEVIERNANAQARLLRDLFDVSRMVAGKLELQLELLPSLRTLVEAALESLVPSGQKNDVRVAMDLGLATVPVMVDAHRLQQVIWNLVSNALKFTPAGGLVRVSCKLQGDWAVLEVADTGKGISQEFLPYVFERFRQEQPEHQRRGLGLGLAISRCIVELHGGVISVHSDGEQRGTTFTVSLPCAALASRSSG